MPGSVWHALLDLRRRGSTAIVSRNSMNEPPIEPLPYRASSDEPRGGPIAAQAITSCVLVAVQVLASVLLVLAAFAAHPIAGVGAIAGALLWLGLIIRFAVKNVHNPAKKGWV